ncbi:MAG: hypothetical protein JKY43_01640 [Phycisphaerales bacterium]|nr:hypothetical protein [Phycisphaerales bacterium]
MQFKSFFCVSVLFFALLLPACAGIKERETERLLLLHKRYSGSIIRIDMRKENGGISGGTAFYTGQGTEFITARHVLMHEDEKGVEYPTDRIMLHIPSCETSYTANMGDHSEDNIIATLNDWANFTPDTDILTRRPLIYDPQYPLHNGQQVFIAGYPFLNRDYDYVGNFPIEMIATRSFFVYATTHHFGTTSQTGDQKFTLVKLADALYDDQAGRGMSGGPVLVWDTTIQDFIAVGILVRISQTLRTKSPLLYFIRPDIPLIMPDPEIN